MMDISNFGTLIATIVAAGSFVFGVLQYVRAEKVRHDDRRIEAARPFLELQLELYKEATSAASILSTSFDDDVCAQTLEQFERLYFGQLLMVEDGRVEVAMRALRDELIGNLRKEELQELSLDLARACRASLADSWNTSAWTYRSS